MLVKLIKADYGNDRNLNCAQKILYASNDAYKMGLDEEALSLASGFGGGMGIESTCGALTAGVMVLGKLFPIYDLDSKKHLYSLTKEYIETYKNKMGFIDCSLLKKEHRTEEIGCKNVIVEAAIILDKIVQREINTISNRK